VLKIQDFHILFETAFLFTHVLDMLSLFLKLFNRSDAIPGMMLMMFSKQKRVESLGRYQFEQREMKKS
jgi:hypothetical protein